MSSREKPIRTSGIEQYLRIGVVDCHSARGLDADQRHKSLIPIGTSGSIFAPNNRRSRKAVHDALRVKRRPPPQRVGGFTMKRKPSPNFCGYRRRRTAA